ncbi:MAG: transcription antitermination factor NusB [Bacteroidota bacterium]
MLSRRSVRIKVMQLLFALGRDQHLDKSAVVERYDELVNQSYQMTLFNLFVLMRVAEKSEEDQVKRKGKHLPSEYDKNFSAIIYHNALMSSLVENELLDKYFKSKDFASKVDEDLILKIYKNFAKEELYKDYVIKPDKTDDDHKLMILELSKFVRKNEHFLEMVSDHFTNWYDDSSLVIGTMKKMIKSLPKSDDFYQAHLPDPEKVDFGRELLKVCVDEDQQYHEIIEPTLKNWDSERLAIIDMILLKMALSEFLNFKTIPTKVTLNEYVEIAKLYSTPKSKDFINGILDRLMKQLTNEGKIAKEGRGLVE